MDQQKIIDESITLDVQQPKLNKLYLVCSINSKEPFTDPETIQTDFITQKSETLMALKIPRMFAYIGLTGTKAVQNKQHEELPNQLLCCFRLLDVDNIIAGYMDGRIMQKQISTQRIIKEFNRQNQEPIIKKRPIKIHIFQKYFVTLFLEGVVCIYHQDYLMFKFYNEYEKFIRLSFQYHKKLVSQKTLKKFESDPNFHYHYLNYGEFSNFQFCQPKMNPQFIFRFESMSINDIEILPFSPLEHLNKPEQRMEKGLCIAMSGLDGYFRLLDVMSNKPLFSFKTECCGICSFSFNPNFSSVCLGAQDDSAYVINFNSKISWIRLVGHNSFISRGVFSSISATEFRIICGCYDGTISITDVDLNQLNPENGLFVKAQEKEKVLQVKNIQSVSQDGVANVAEFQNYVVCMNFDGVIKIFLLQ
ncbi:unnamed protein product [Paramecium pentaurelia]|uniref:Uncharacterized protein n=1 Tax=Paramecium pentaurelia TaxID=43138 RepID=A0A8S1WZC0_9CILI|nr:unnamed protein product [Paramecium pentaurelia]